MHLHLVATKQLAFLAFIFLFGLLPLWLSWHPWTLVVTLLVATMQLAFFFWLSPCCLGICFFGTFGIPGGHFDGGYLATSSVGIPGGHLAGGYLAASALGNHLAGEASTSLMFWHPGILAGILASLLASWLPGILASLLVRLLLLWRVWHPGWLPCWCFGILAVGAFGIIASLQLALLASLHP